MGSLADQQCKPCEGGVDPLTEDRAQELLKQLDGGWSLHDGGKAITREFEFDNFHETMAFVNALAWVAHRQDHHPDLEVGYDRCRVTWSTHAIDGLSENDFICAAKLDRL